MAQSGGVIEHPVTGEKFVFRKTARDTGGEAFEVDFYVQPGAFAAAQHIHPLQEERFEIVSGTVCVRVAGKETLKGAGEEVVIPAGTPHVWWNAGDDELRMRVAFHPALRSESFFETFFGLAQDGKVSRKTGLPNLLQTVVTLRAYRNEIILARPSRLAQIVLFGPLAALGRLLGYRADYPYPYAKQAHAQPQTL